YPGIVLPGDFDNDGNVDVASNTVVVFGTGSGGVDGTTMIGDFVSSYGLVAADFDRDGDDDIFASENTAPSLLRSDGHRGFSTERLDFSLFNPKSAAGGDFNSDGNPDVVVASPAGSTQSGDSGYVYLLIGDGNGGFEPRKFLAGQNPYGVSVGDVNRDGDLDVVSSDYVLRIVHVLLGDGNGSLSPDVRYPLEAGVPTEHPGGGATFYERLAALADFDGDGNLDVAVPGDHDGRLLFARGNGNGAFVPDGFVSIPGGTRSIASGDFDADSDPDLIVSSTLGHLQALRNTRTGIPVDTTPPSVTCGQADGTWHGVNVTITCVASDAGTGLLNPSNAHFELVTVIADGTASSNAATGSRSVCDVAGNCTQAGPITGHRVDRKSPAITCANPDHSWRSTNASVSCTSSDSDAGLASAPDAAFSVSTAVPPGATDANAAATVRTVCDVVGNCSSTSQAGFRIDRTPPQVSITRPVGNYAFGQSVSAQFGCSDPGGSGIASCSAPVGNGQSVNTFFFGTRTFTVAATDVVGNTYSLSSSYAVSLFCIPFIGCL
ncbi:MAG: FG-GAP repeat domain-containing protein, partial [Solirubrobacterales bacterium]